MAQRIDSNDLSDISRTPEPGSDPGWSEQNATQSHVERAAYDPFRVGSIQDVVTNLQHSLGKDYKIIDQGKISGTSAEGTPRSYSRITVSHRGGREMVMDIRHLERAPGSAIEGPITGGPVIAIRQEGQVGEAAERTYAGKAWRAGTEGANYKVYNAIDEIADLIRAGHQVYENAPARGRVTPTSALASVMSYSETGRGASETREAVRAFHVTPASGLAWGQQRPGFYETIASKISIYWGPERRYKEEKILTESLADIRYRTQSPVFYDPVHRVIQAWRREESRFGAFNEDEIQLARMGEGGLKTMKQLPSLLGSREEVHPVVSAFNEATGRVMKTGITTPTPDEILGIGAPPEKVARGKQYPLTGRPEFYGERLAQRGGIFMNIRGETVLQMPSIITQMPSGAGAAYLAKRAIPQTDSAGNPISFAFRGSQVVPLPWQTPEELYDVLKASQKAQVPAISIFDVAGKTSKANARMGLKLGTVSVLGETGELARKPLYTGPKAYENQIDSVTMVVPKFFNASTNQFSGYIPSNLSAEQRAAWTETASVEGDIRKLFGKNQINIEYSGAERMYLSVTTTGAVDLGMKLRGVKQGGLPTGLEGWNIKVPGVGVARAVALTQEVKSAGDIWVGAWEVQPFENKMAMLGMIDPRLEARIRILVQQGKNGISRNNLPPSLVANEYKSLGTPGNPIPYNSPRELIGKAITKILDEQDPTLRGANYRRYGIYSITDPSARVKSELLTQEGVDYYKANYHDDQGRKVNPELDGIRFVREGGLFRVVSRVLPGSYLIPTVIGMTAEWPQGGGKIPVKAVEQFNMAYPKISQVLGLEASQGVLGAGHPEANVRAWLDLVKSDKMRQSAQTGTLFKTPNTLMIDQKMARSILASLGIDQSSLSERPVTLDQIKKLTKILDKQGAGNRPDMLFFKGTQSYMPTTNVPRYLDEYNKATGASTTGMATRYLGAILDLLGAESSGRAQPGPATRRFYNYQEGMIERSSQANKVLSTIRTGAAMSRNYNVLDFLAPNEAVMSDAQLEAIARKQPGVTTAEDLKNYVAYIKKNGYMPAFFHRIPSVGGVHAIKILTAETFAKKYPEAKIDINADIASAQGTIWVNRWMHETGIGDRDVDKALIWTGLVTGKVRGKLTVKDLITNLPEWQRSMRKTGADYVKEFRANLGEDEELIREYSHIGQYWADYHGMATTKGFDPKKNADYGWVRTGILNDAAANFAEIRARRATSYSVVEFMRETNAALGINAEQLTRALGSYGIRNYQSSLEATQKARLGDPFEKFFPSIRMNQEGGLKFSVGLPDSKGKLAWNNISAGEGISQRQQIISSFLVSYASSAVPNEMIASQFGSINDPGLSVEIMDILKGAKGIERFERISNNPDILKRIMNGVSPLGTMVDFSLKQSLTANKNVPLDLRKQLFGEITGGNKMENTVLKVLGLFRSLRTGKGFREHSLQDIEDAATNPNIVAGPEADKLIGFAKALGIADLEEIPMAKEWGGLGKIMMQNRFKQGMRSMRASDFSAVAAGIESYDIKNLRANKVLYQKVLGMTSEWIGQMYQVKGMEDIFGKPAANEERSFYDKALAENEGKALGYRINKGMTITADIGGTQMRFKPGFMKLEDGKLIVTETKYGGTPTKGSWKALISKYGIINAYQQNKDMLRKAITSYKSSYDEMQGTDEGSHLPPLSDSWVEETMHAIGEGNVEARVLHIAKRGGEYNLFKVKNTLQETERMVKDVRELIKEEGPASIEDLERLSEGERLSTLDAYNKEMVRTIKGFKMPGGIRESFMRLISLAKFQNAGGVPRFYTQQMGSRDIFDRFDNVVNNQGIGLVPNDLEAIALSRGGGFTTPNRPLPPLLPPGAESAKSLAFHQQQLLKEQYGDELPANFQGALPAEYSRLYKEAGADALDRQAVANVIPLGPGSTRPTRDTGVGNVAPYAAAAQWANIGLKEEDIRAKLAEKYGDAIPDLGEDNWRVLRAAIAAQPVRADNEEIPGATGGTKERMDATVEARPQSARTQVPSGGGTAGIPPVGGTPIPSAGGTGSGSKGGGDWNKFIPSNVFEAQRWVAEQHFAMQATQKALGEINPLAQKILEQAAPTYLEVAKTTSPAAALQAALSKGGDQAAKITSALKESDAGRELLAKAQEAAGIQGAEKFAQGSRYINNTLANIAQYATSSPGYAELAGGKGTQAAGEASGLMGLVDQLKGADLIKGGKGGAGGAGWGVAGELMTEQQTKNVSQAANILAESFSKVEERMASTNDVVKRSTELWRETGVAIANPAIASTIEKLETTLGQMGKLPEGKYTTAALGQMGLRAAGEILAQPGVTAEQQTTAKGLVAGAGQLLRQVEGAETKIRKDIQSEGADVGHIARRALGGFGVMYLRSMMGLATGGLAAGTQEAAALRTQWGEAAARGTGVAQPYITNAQRNIVMAGVYGTPNNPMEGIAGIFQRGMGREIAGAGQMGIGTFAASQWFGGVAGGKDNPLGKAFMGWAGTALTAATVIGGGVADVLRQQKDIRSLAFGQAMAGAGEQYSNYSITGRIAALTMPAAKQEEYQRLLQANQGMMGWAGLGKTPEEAAISDVRMSSPAQRGRGATISTAGRAEQAQWNVAKGKGAYEALLLSGVQGSKSEIVAQGIPLIAAAITAAHPEYQAISGDVASFAAQNNLTQREMDRLLPQWQFGAASPEFATNLGAAFGQNLSTMKGGISGQVMGLTNVAMLSQQRDIVMQGAQAAAGLGAFSQNMIERGRGRIAPIQNYGEDRYVRTMPSAVELDVRQKVNVARQLAPVYGTAGYGAMQAAAGAYMQTLGTGAQMPMPMAQQYYNMSTAQAQLAQGAAQANLQAFGTYQNIAMYGAKVQAPTYLGPNATDVEIQQAKLRDQLLQDTQGATVREIGTNLALQGFDIGPPGRGREDRRDRIGGRGLSQVQTEIAKMDLTGVAGRTQAQYSSLRTQYIQSLQQMGLPYSPSATMQIAPVSMAAPGANLGDMARLTAQAQQANQWFQQAQPAIAAGNDTLANVSQFANWYSAAPKNQAAFANQLMNMAPIAFQAAAAIGGPAANALFSAQLPSYGNAPVDMNAFAMTGTSFTSPFAQNARPNGMPYGAVNLAYGMQSNAQVAQMAWGGNVAMGANGQANWTPGPNLMGGPGYSQGMINAALNGVQTPFGRQGGMYAMQSYANLQNYQSSMAGVGNQMAGLNLSMAFTTGVGLQKYGGIVNPVTQQPFNFNTGPTSFNVAGVGGYTSQSGGFWGVTEAQRAISNMQQTSQFNAQQQQMGIQSGQFYTNMAQQQQQMGMQRGWQQQDWGYNAQIRGLQWQYQQQDFQENVRFMTGRDRRLAERGMGRATTLHDLESDQISKTQDRQRQLWSLEDTRFATQKQQFEENRNFQQEQLNKARSFFEANKAMTEESDRMQRAYWIAQQELQRQAAAIAAGAAENQYKFNKTIQDYQLYADLAKASIDTLNQDGVDALIKNIETNSPVLAAALNETFGSIFEWLKTLGYAGPGPTTPNPPGDPHEGMVQCSKCGGWYRPGGAVHHCPTAAGFSGWAFGATNFTAGEGALPEKVTVRPLGQGTYTAGDTYRSRWNDSVTSMPASYGVPAEGKPLHLVIQIGDEVLMDRVIDQVDQEIKI